MTKPYPTTNLVMLKDLLMGSSQGPTPIKKHRQLMQDELSVLFHSRGTLFQILF